MAQRKQSIEVGKRFLKVMRYVICEELRDVTNKTEFCNAVGEYQQNLTKIESGARYPTIEVMIACCKLFGISPAWFLLGEGQMLAAPAKDNNATILKRLESIEKLLTASQQNSNTFPMNPNEMRSFLKKQH